MKNKIIVLQIIFIVILASCSRQKYKIPQADVKDIPEVKVNIHRYGKALFQLDTAHFAEGLKSIHKEFRFFLGDNPDGEQNIRQLLDYVSDTQIISIYHKTVEVFPDVGHLEESLSDAFSRYRYFFPGHTLPGVYTYVSDIYYEAPVMKKDTVLIIALDDYLGADFPIYRALGIPLYRAKCMQPDHIPVDVMKTLYNDELAVHSKMKTLLDRMIYEGKLLVYLDAVLPGMPDTAKICYTGRKMQWAIDHEKEIWGFLVENKLLFSTDYQMISKLMQDGPFTNGFGNQSPSRLGVFMGWQIVREFMINNPDVSPKQMLEITDSQTILERSRYKP